MLAYIEAIHDFKRNKEAALTVLKKYTRNDDREVLEDSYSNYANKYLALPIPTPDGIRTILTELSSTVPAAKNADPEQFVSYKVARRSKRAVLSNGSTRSRGQNASIQPQDREHHAFRSEGFGFDVVQPTPC